MDAAELVPSPAIQSEEGKGVDRGVEGHLGGEEEEVSRQ